MSLGTSSVEGPLSVIANIKAERDWPRAVVMLAIYLEKHSYLAVREHFEFLKDKIDNKEHWKAMQESLERLHLLDYGLTLLSAEKIDSDEFYTMKCINIVRNNWVHRKEKYRYKIGTEAKEEYLPLLERGERLLAKLFITEVHIFRR